MQIRRFRPEDARAVSDLVRRTLRESNAKDYPVGEIGAMVISHTPEFMEKRAMYSHFYVACEGEEILGCGAIGPYWDREDESSLFTFFVRPDCQGRGVGRKIMEALEADEYFLRADRIEVPASITGVGFYRRMGYGYKNGVAEPDEERLVRMEKFRGARAHIRRAEKEDLPILATLAGRLWPDAEGLREELGESVGARDEALFLAFVDGETAGFAHCALRWDYVEGKEGDGPVGYLEGVYVEKPFRRQGVGRALTAVCEAWAREKGCKEFASDTPVSNGDGVLFHLGSGFREAGRQVCFIKKL